MPQSTLNLCYSRIYPPVRDFFGICPLYKERCDIDMLTYSSRQKSLKSVIESNNWKNSFARCDYPLIRKKKSTAMKLRSQQTKKGKSVEQSISLFCPVKSLKKSHPVNKTRNLQVENTSVCEIYSWCPVEDDNFPHGNER